eukprot:scaffold19440_cov29-Prasinocladus_malaysianus.AAC.1
MSRLGHFTNPSFKWLHLPQILPFSSCQNQTQSMPIIWGSLALQDSPGSEGWSPDRGTADEPGEDEDEEDENLDRDNSQSPEHQTTPQGGGRRQGKDGHASKRAKYQTQQPVCDTSNA